MTGNKFDLILQVFRVITGIKITKNGDFTRFDCISFNFIVYLFRILHSVGEIDAVRCSLKAHDGYLYPLAKCFIFVYNPITLIPYDAIAHIEFARLQGTQSSRTFDLVIFMKPTKVASEKTYIFQSINK